MTDEPDLTLVATDTLIDEIFRRHDAVIVARVASRTVGRSRFAYSYSGTQISAIGLCEQAKRQLLAIEMDEVPQTPNDDDSEAT